ncbi:MAG: response regulator, partial [Candidatus Obscuribacterales bacterium]|nr:response regulator [Candidatus Obscuribacterales bacterium]
MATDSDSISSSKNNDRSEKHRERLVLLIEPAESDRAKCQEIIVSHSPLYDVDTAGSAEEALNLFDLKKYDAVVMSYDLPDMSGEQAARALSKKNPNCPIVVTTATD